MTTKTKARFGAAEKKRFINLTRKGRDFTAAAESVGFTARTVRQHLSADPKFLAAYDQAMESLDDFAEGKLFEKVQDGNLQAIMFWNMNRRPHRWRDMKTIQTQITGGGGGPIQVASVVAFSLRDALDDPATRHAALGLARAIEPATRHDRAVEAHGHAIASPGGVLDR